MTLVLSTLNSHSQLSTLNNHPEHILTVHRLGYRFVG
jgi:hypothetical protein